MSTLWFSLAIRETIELLQQYLGSSFLVMAYLDDIIVLGAEEGTLNLCLEFFEAAGAPMELNPTKCKQFELADTANAPIHLLGTCIGPAAARKSFLGERIEQLRESTSNLPKASRQTGLLILRKSLQLKHRHLLRSMQSADIMDTWAELDTVIHTAFDRIRGLSPQPDLAERDRVIISLPTSLGGMGLMSHVDTAPLAYQAASNSALDILRPIVPSLERSSDARTQRELSHEVTLIKQEQMMTSLSTRDRVLVVEAASQIGRRWLDIVPSSSRYTLSDTDVQANLLYRTLLPGYVGACIRCTQRNEPGHDECCPGRKDHRISRHEAVKYAMAAGLSAISTLTVDIEPFMPDLRRRNDIRIKHNTDAHRPSPAEEYDLKVVALSAPSHQRSLAVSDVILRPNDSSILKQTHEKIQKVLAYQAKRKVDALPALTTARVPFAPIVLSSGGIAEKGAFDKLKLWKSWATNPTSHQWMLSSVSVSLAKARGRTFLLE
jgi:hypothetical protein